MNRWLKFCAIAVVLTGTLTQQASAALIWRRGEGWSWEHGGLPMAANAKEQMEYGQRFEEKGDWNAAASSYRRLLKKWPTSSFAPEAQYRIGICLENEQYYFDALRAYQRTLETYPNTPQFKEILERQFKIGNLFLSGTRHKVWKLKIFPGTEKAVEAFEMVIRNAPSSDVAAQSQFHIGLAREKQGLWAQAVAAYQKVLDQYYNSEWVDDATFQMGYAYYRESRSADYDKEAARRSLDSFTDFINSYPQDERVKTANEYVSELNLRDAEGLYKIAQFYEKRKKEKAAMIYYSELVRLHRQTEYAQRAIPRLEQFKAKFTPTPDSGAGKNAPPSTP